RFGTRLDENTRRSIEHGRRIRECLKQPQFEPTAVPEQISVLLALTSRLFDPVPLDRMPEAERAVRSAVKRLPEEIFRPILSGQDLCREHRDLLLRTAREALAGMASTTITEVNEGTEKS
ncbi:MAG: F0F1 ATP synthase subunit alpha, partial [Verrucomicrobia bacterium]|nr:F0F1 ATP synthase subunit alpha [Verrucomicrobiota bacterium]